MEKSKNFLNGLDLVSNFLKAHFEKITFLTVNHHGRTVIHFDANVCNEANLKGFMDNLNIKDYECSFNYLLNSHSVSFKLQNCNARLEIAES